MDIAWAFRSLVINVGLCLVAGQGVRGGLGSIAGLVVLLDWRAS